MTAKRRVKTGITAVEYQERKVVEAQLDGDPERVRIAHLILTLVRACR